MYDQLEIFCLFDNPKFVLPPCENERISPEKKDHFKKKVFQPTFSGDTVDGKNPANQLRLVVYPPYLPGLVHATGGWLRCPNHQQY